MRICYVAYPNSLKLRSANAVQTHATLRALRALAPDTLAIVPRIESGPGAFDGLALHLPRIGIGRLSRVYRSTLWYYAERSVYAWMVLALLTWLRLARRQCFDVIYVREVICALWLALLAPRLTGARVVYEVHDLESRNPSRAKEGWAQPLLHLIDRLTLTRPAALTSLTATFRDMLASTGLRDPCEVAVLPDAYDETRYAPQDRDAARQSLGLSDEPTIVYAGLTFAYRGVDLLLDAMVDVPGARLILVGGRDAERATLGERAQRLGIGERVTFAGVQPQDRVPLYRHTEQVLIQCALVDACLWIITRYTIDGAIMFDQFNRAIRQATPLAHVPVFVQNGRQFSDPFRQWAPLQTWRVFGVQTLSPRLKQAVDRLLASLRLDKLQRVDQQMVVCFGEERLSSGSKRV